MKKLLILLILTTVLLFSCTGFMAGQQESKVCDLTIHPEAAGSVICQVAYNINMTPEQMDSLFLDSTLLTWTLTNVEAKDVVASIDNIISFMENNSMQDIALEEVVTMVLKESKKSKAFAQIVSRHITAFNVPQLMTDYDKRLTMIHLDHQRAQFTALM